MLSSVLKRFIRDKPKAPRLRVTCIPPISPPPGLNLKAPEDWNVDKFFRKIGGDTEEYADKFETVNEVLSSDRYQFREKGVPAKTRKYIMRVTEMLRRGVLSFEVLDRRHTPN
mmetsp:Transcript_28167/g.50385  ORF Transcript_28167/g.50385 Transcript_28167/m.50385 type:complete len:113 (+) Transcript_28167:29-367(+)